MATVYAHPVSDIERAKYNAVWSLAEYAKDSPGENAVGWFLKEWGWPHAADPAGRWVLDVGCGTGRAGAKFAALGCRVTLIDWGINGCPVQIPEGLPLLDTCLWHDWPSRLVGSPSEHQIRSQAIWGRDEELVRMMHSRADLAYCVDVLEHIPTEFVGLVVSNMLRAARYVFVQVAHFDDTHFGDQVRDTLHLTIRPFEWWRDRLADLGALVEARDCVQSSAFLLVSGGVQ